MAERRWFWLFCIPLVVTIIGGVIVNQLIDKPQPTTQPIARDPTGPVTLACNETYYDKTGNNPFPVPRFFTHYPGSKLIWDNYKQDSPLTLQISHETPAIIVAEAETSELMPRRDQIDVCIQKEISDRPDLIDTAGAVNPFSALSCTGSADQADMETPVHLKVTINRVTGALVIKRLADYAAGAFKVSTGGSVYDTEHSGECTVAEKRL